jgi:hypothetical protein
MLPAVAGRGLSDGLGIAAQSLSRLIGTIPFRFMWWAFKSSAIFAFAALALT